MEDIKMPIYYIIEESGEKYYDFEEMANELENRICEKLGRNVLITISETETIRSSVWRKNNGSSKK